MSSEREDPEKQPLSWKQRLLSKDTTRFKKYIESTTGNGVGHIFISKSYIRRLFWLVVVLGATGGCLYSISDRVKFLVSKPTSTTVSTERRAMLDFPAVTVCNLNRFRKSVLSEVDGFAEVIRAVFYTSDDLETCENLTRPLATRLPTELAGVSLQDLTYEARHRLEDFIVFCRYQGRECNLTRDFIPILTRLGVCYTFNAGPVISGEPVKTNNGTGTRNGLRMLVNISQSEYVASTDRDAGIKVAIHPQADPPMPDDDGIGVPVGTNAFISLRQQSIIDNTKRKCRTSDDVGDFNFLRDEYNYSISACIEDCFYTNLADKCSCLEAREQYAPDVERYRSLPNCTFDNLCCEISQTINPQSCVCKTACTSKTYIVTNSYSLFPAEYAVQDLLTELNVSRDIISPNLLAVNVYFETFNEEILTTNNAYSAIALLSDIGGQVGLFLGVSVITILEFVTWIVDEVKDRVFGISEKKLARKYCSCCGRIQRKEAVGDRLEKTSMVSGCEDGEVEGTRYELFETQPEGNKMSAILWRRP